VHACVRACVRGWMCVYVCEHTIVDTLQLLSAEHGQQTATTCVCVFEGGGGNNDCQQSALGASLDGVGWPGLLTC
jgi:hypothetical protein